MMRSMTRYSFHLCLGWRAGTTQRKGTRLLLAERGRLLIFSFMHKFKNKFPFIALALLLLSCLAGPALAACTDPAAAAVNWRRCYLDGRDLKGAVLTDAMLREATFMRSDLSGADLTGSDAYRAKFFSAKLTQTHLDRARLIEADFTNADLTGATLAGADLRNAKLVGVKLVGADLTGALIGGADLRNADLSGATWADGIKVCGPGSIGQCH
ncbi:Pentapeptide repeat-containing protein [Azospirillum sp. RU38E]|nr:Pentapeptide repeat-containing protein [Azospirillum sp. RU38E]SNS43554.1 Pentapeptide repeat-containing protein [Azospirillum sp. RU37A]